MLERNERYKISIDSLNSEGQGVGRINGFVVFVPGALPGETVDAIIIKPGKSYAVARMIGITGIEDNAKEPDESVRAAPACSSFPSCGGCRLLHMSYNAQLEFKRNQVIQALTRLGGLEGVDVLPAIGMAHPFDYRNKAQFPVSLGNNGQEEIGFYSSRSHIVVDSDTCMIHHPACDAVRNIIRQFITVENISAYDEEWHIGLLRHLIVRVGIRTGDVMVVLVINGNKLPLPYSAEKLVSMLKDNIQGFKSLWLNINTQKSNVIMGNKCVKLWGTDTISERIGSLNFRISPLSFFQVNTEQAEILYEKVKEFAEINSRDNVFDLYCGTGIIGLYLADAAKTVTGIENVAQAVDDARLNAAANNILNASFICGNAETEIGRLYSSGQKADVVIVDPPRKGCEVSLLNTIIDMKPDKVVYVSCNPATLARDLSVLHGSGVYQVKKIQPVDMFPHTPHVETVVLMSRVDK